MRPLYDDFDDFDDFDFADSAVVKKMMQEQLRDEIRRKSRRLHGPGRRRAPDDFDDDEDFDDFDEFDDYDDYDDDEFDRYAGMKLEN